MNMFEKVKLPDSVEAEVELFTQRIREFAVRMYTADPTEEGRADRTMQVAILAIEASDFVDSVDHRTAAKLGGTENIQQFCSELREAGRQMTDTIPQPPRLRLVTSD